jgi:hypothetical protein
MFINYLLQVGIFVLACELLSDYSITLSYFSFGYISASPPYTDSFAIITRDPACQALSYHPQQID